MAWRQYGNTVYLVWVVPPELAELIMVFHKVAITPPNTIGGNSGIRFSMLLTITFGSSKTGNTHGKMFNMLSH